MRDSMAQMGAEVRQKNTDDYKNFLSTGECVRACVCVCVYTHTLSHTLSHSHTHSLTHSLTHS
jgi:hypothetical protein